jgi:protein O-mannosyl-transferase
MTLNRWWPIVGLALLLAATWLAYAPGLSGDFLFDDFVNLDKLSAPGPVDDWPSFWRYITSGIADPIGRPLSLLTFLVDANRWPADPAPFLRTNVLLHLLNGALLYLLLRRLSRYIGDDRGQTEFAALAGTGLWLLHPLFVSTTLYIVQREAMLPATFTLLGLIAYTHGREQLARAPSKGMAWMIGAIGLGTLLAMLCKANGILLPMLAWIIEAIVLRRGLDTRPPRWFAMTALALPTLVVFAYLLAQLGSLHAPIGHRPWTIAERLLTEPRVLADYLRLLAIPRVLSTGVYNDGYVVSHRLLDPPTTWVALLFIMGLLTGAILLRKHVPALSAALLFFFAGHAMESTTIPLELFFEHRNYLPAMLLGWPVGRALARWEVVPAARIGVAVMLLAICGATTFQRADLWGHPERMIQLWAMQNPSSSRAIATSALYRIRAGDAAGARTMLAPLLPERPQDLQIVLNYASAACGTGGLTRADVRHVENALARFEEGDQMVYRWLDRALDTAAHGDCRGLGLEDVEAWIAAAWRNPRISAMAGRRQDLDSLQGRLLLLQGDSAGALRAFNRALDAEPAPDAAGAQAAYLATRGDYVGALAHLDHYEALLREPRPAPGWGMPRVHVWVLDRQGYWSYELGRLRHNLEAEIRANKEPHG